MRFIARTDGMLFDLLRARFPDSSKTTIRGMLRRRQVSLDGRQASRAGTPVHAGQVIEIASGRGPAAQPPGRILFRDPHLLALEKPPGLLSVARDGTGGDSFYRRLNEYLHACLGGRERVFIVHRLDREASGILLFARSPSIQERLQRTWRSAEKRYWALVEGCPPEEAGTIRSWLRENRAHQVYSDRQGPGAKLAITHYRRRRVGSRRSLLEVRIETGRKNQIRVHLSELGCPIVGDRRYGARTNAIRRFGLHAYFLAFTHPVSGARIRLRLPLPKAFRVG